MAKRTAEEKPVRKMLTLRIPVELHRELKIEAARAGVSMEALVVEALRKRLPGKEGDKA